MCELLHLHHITTVIWLVVQRFTDICEKDWSLTKHTNVDLVDNITAICARLSIRFIHVSTDYVFDGFKQPNSPSDPTHPLQKYGMSKLMSEQIVQQAYAADPTNYVILRVPVLYNANTAAHNALANNAVTVLVKPLLDLRLTAPLVHEDDLSIRRPVWVPDLVHFLIEHVLTTTTPTLSGVHHFYNPHHLFTKYQMAAHIADFLKLTSGHRLRPNRQPPSANAAPRPYDTQLHDPQLHTVIMQHPFTDFGSTIGQCFQRFQHDPRAISKTLYMFDLDGTLVDSFAAHYTAYHRAFAKANRPFITYKEFTQVITSQHLDTYLQTKYPDINMEAVRHDKRTFFTASEVQWMPGAQALLTFLAANNGNFCVVTNTSQDTVSRLLAQPHLVTLNLVTQWITRDDCPLSPKPDPHPYTLAGERFKRHDTTQLVAIEDSYVGYCAAKGATDLVYWVTSETNLPATNDAFIVDSLEFFLP
jgi:dTDP-4-dehydrorhamnose reductase/beta-phosphoglucomutase-like phosphatase (HAD superfamily)